MKFYLSKKYILVLFIALFNVIFMNDNYEKNNLYIKSIGNTIYYHDNYITINNTSLFNNKNHFYITQYYDNIIIDKFSCLNTIHILSKKNNLITNSICDNYINLHLYNNFCYKHNYINLCSTIDDITIYNIINKLEKPSITYILVVIVSIIYIFYYIYSNYI